MDSFNQDPIHPSSPAGPTHSDPWKLEPSGFTVCDDGEKWKHRGASLGAHKERFLRPDLKMLIRFRDIKHDNLMVFGGN